MGYRSDLVVLIYPDTVNKIDTQALYDQLKMLMATTFSEVVKSFEAEMYWGDARHVLKFILENTKWYPSYSDVAAFEAMLREFDGTIAGYCTEFVRIGDNYEDIEVRSSGEHCEYYLSVNRDIVCDI